MTWIVNDWPGASAGAVQWTVCDPPAVVTRQLPSVLVADRTRNWSAGSVSVTSADRQGLRLGPVEDRVELSAAGGLDEAPLEQLDAAGWPIATRAR